MGGTVDGVALPKEILDAGIPLRVIEVRSGARLCAERQWVQRWACRAGDDAQGASAQHARLIPLSSTAMLSEGLAAG